MAKLLCLLVVQVVLFSDGAMHIRHNKFDFEKFARTLDDPEILRPVHFHKGRGIPHLDLEKFFQTVNNFIDFHEATKEASNIGEDLDYHPWKKEDIEKLTNLDMNDDTSLLRFQTDFLKEFQNFNGINKAFSLAEKAEEKDKCPVGTLFYYMVVLKNVPKECFHFSAEAMAIRLLKYKLTSPVESPPQFPTQTSNLIEALAAPVLNQPKALVVLDSLRQGLKDYNFKTPLMLTWPFLWLGNALRNKQMASHYLTPGNVPNLTTFDGYGEFLDEYRRKQKEKLFGIFPMKHFIHYPLVEDLFSKDITRQNNWQSDDIFAQQRLAGLNPMSLRKLSVNDPILGFFNESIVDAIVKVSCKSFNETIQDGNVFVLDYPLLHGIANIENIEANDPGKRKMRRSVSPIAVFISKPTSTKDGKSENTLKPVAIQMDRDPDAPVFTPKDGDKWMMAKEEVQRADFIYVEIIEHLLKTHLLMQPICTIMYRTFRKLHPLYQLFHPHCKYLTVTNSAGIPALFDEHEYTHILFSIGNTGAINLLNKGYKNMSWEDTNFKKNLEKRGVMNKETLPYFPYRDDGLLLWDKVEMLAEEYVDLYYPKSGSFLGLFSPSVLFDIELQSFALQLNSARILKIAGGRFKGFPKFITTRKVLVDVVKRILFIPIQHSAINYPVSYYGAFTPNMPTKLYNPDTQDFGIDCLPHYNIVAYQLSIAMTLGSIRYDKLFDYSDDMADDKAKTLIRKYYDDLHGAVNKKIFEKNCERHLKGKLIYPYFMPQWLTNSIQT